MNKRHILLILAINLFSNGSALRFERESSDEPTVEKLHSVSTIRSRFANTVIVSVLENPSSSAKLATFTATLPDDAFISNFSMTIKDKVIIGDVKEKEAAKKAFDKAVEAGESAGHVAQRARETNKFDISVNVGGKESVRFELTYQEVLQRVHGVYKHTVNIATKQVIPDLKVHVSIAESRKITTLHVPEVVVKQAEKNNKDLLLLPDAKAVKVDQTDTDDGSFADIDYQPTEAMQKANVDEDGLAQLVVLYDVERSDDAGELMVVDGYFVHFFAPTEIKVAPKRIVFVIDISGSMQGVKLQQTKDAMTTILSDLNTEDKFNIITFDDEVEEWTNEFQPKSKVSSAIDHVKDLKDDGGTNINDAMLEAIQQFEGKSQTGDSIIFLTDGQATAGETGKDEILSNIKAALNKTPVTIHTISFGEGADYDLLKSISLLANGLAKKVYEDSDSALQMEGFYAQIGNPLMSDVKIKYLNASLEPDSIVADSKYNLYKGSEIITLGKLSSSQNDDKLTAVVSGDSAAGSRVLRCMPMPPPDCPVPMMKVADEEIARLIWWPPYCPPWRPIPITTTTRRPVTDARSLGGYLERMWAKKRIDKLLEDSKYGEDLSTRSTDDKRDKALKLSLKYNFVTELTSMVVIQGSEVKPLAESVDIPRGSEDVFLPASFAAGAGGGRGRVSGAMAPMVFAKPLKEEEEDSSPVADKPRPTNRPRPTKPRIPSTRRPTTTTTETTKPGECPRRTLQLIINSISMFDCSNKDCPIGYKCNGDICCSDPDALDSDDIKDCTDKRTYFSPCVEYEYTCNEVKAAHGKPPAIKSTNRPKCTIGGCVCITGYARDSTGECIQYSRC